MQTKLLEGWIRYEIGMRRGDALRCACESLAASGYADASPLLSYVDEGGLTFQFDTATERSLPPVWVPAGWHWVAEV